MAFSPTYFKQSQLNIIKWVRNLYAFKAPKSEYKESSKMRNSNGRFIKKIVGRVGPASKIN